MVQVEAFLARYPPFDALPPEELRRVARAVEIAFFPAGSTILLRAGEPAGSLYVVRTGAVELVEDGRVVDLLLEGEVFGHPSLLSGLEPAFSVRAHEDTLCYVIDREVAEAVLGRPSGLAFLTASLRKRMERAAEARGPAGADARLLPVGRLVRRPPVTCGPGTTVREAAQLMARERVSSLLVQGGSGRGIVTDRDLRSRVLAAGRDPHTPVSEVMSTPLVTVPAEATTEEVLLTMLEHGVHHLPVTDATGRIVGVVSDTDLMGLERTDPFAVRSAIERAPDRERVVAEAARLPLVVRGLVEADVDPVHVGHAVAIAIDTLTRRLLELAIDELGDPPGPWAWLAFGSQARREQALATDQDHGLAYEPTDADPEDADRYFAALADRVTAGLEAAGIPRCRGGVMAINPAWRRTAAGWEAELRRWMIDPGVRGRVFTSIALDYRRVAGPLDVASRLDEVIREAPRHPGFVRRLALTAVELRPPTGFFRDVVVQQRGAHAGTFAVKDTGITPVTNLARYGAVSAGGIANRTLRRLEVAVASGRLDEELGTGLREAFRLLGRVRLVHHVRRVGEGAEPDDHVDPTELDAIVRRGLKEAFRTIERAQRLLAREMGFRLR